MRKKIREQLPYSIRKIARRAIVVSVRYTIRILSNILNIAASNGLDVKRELHPDLLTHLQLDALPPIPSIPLPAPVQQVDSNGAISPASSLEDFLSVMDVIAASQSARDVAGNASDAKGKIRASIVIPVYGKAEYTFECLRSLIREVDLRETEIIVVNNGSKDETERMLAHMKGFVRLVNNAKNMGFVTACNQGAAIAQGEYLVFLNNDTVVMSRWLEHLIETAEADSAVGAVGSMLVYPDGRLQEAGGIVWIDGNAHNYGKGKSPQERKFNYAREVDYCSGASLLVRKELFDRLGGFDERYAPAYYEDTDLCFGIRALGYKVMYQPMSRLIHHEGATAGTDTQSGYKQYQDINRDKFVRKWRETLRQEHLENHPLHWDIAANRRRGPRVMVFDDMFTTPNHDSGSLRMSLILKTLVKSGHTVFIPVYPLPYPEYELELGKHGVEILHFSDYKDRLREGNFHAAILSRASVADAVLPAIRKLDPSIKIIFDTVDIQFFRLEREFALTGDESFAEEAMLFKKIETRVARASDEVWCVTADDKDVLEKEAPGARVKIIPNIHALHERGKDFDERAGLLFIGNFNHRPNADAVHYFIKDILPRVHDLIPELKFYMVGSNMSDEIRAYASASVVVLGYVQDVSTVFQECRIFVAPLRYGAGMKGKVGQALAYGLPVVTTSIGAEGIGLTHEREALVAETPEDFANSICEAYSNRQLWQRLSDNGYRHIEDNFTPEIVGERILAAIKEL